MPIKKSNSKDLKRQKVKVQPLKRLPVRIGTFPCEYFLRSYSHEEKHKRSECVHGYLLEFVRSNGNANSLNSKRQFTHPNVVSTRTIRCS